MKSSKKIQAIGLFLMILTVLWFPICAFAQDGTAQWTVFIYLCGTDLESDDSEATLNLQSLLSAPATGAVNYVIQTGGTKEWHMEEIDPGKTERFVINNGTMTKVDSLPLEDMGKSDTLGRFLSWGAKAYPAEKYMAILWDHGGGPLSGAIWDELHEDSHMTVPELAEGISQAGVPFEIIGFDACLMGSIEIAHMLAPYGKYFVASEETEPGSGWDYEQLGTFLAEYPDTNGVYLGKLICDTFKWANDSSILLPNSHTLSVIDLAKIAPLSEALGSLIQEWGDIIPDIVDYQVLIHDLASTEKYTAGSTIDIGDMVLRAESLDPLSTQKVRIAMNEAVVYSVRGTSRSDSYGLSFMYEQGLTAETLDEYAKVCPMPEYLAYLDAVNTDWTAPGWVYEQTAIIAEPDTALYNVAFETELNFDGQWEMRLTQGTDAVQMVNYSLFSMEDNGVFYGTSSQVAADWDNGVFVDGFDGTWPALGGQFCAMELIYDQGEYALFNIPVSVEDEESEEVMNLRAAYWYETDDHSAYFDLYGFGSDDGSAGILPSKDVYPLEDGIIITPLYENVSDDEFQYVKGEPVEYIEGETVLQPEPLPDGDYAIAFEVTDLFGEYQLSDFLGVTISDGVVL